MFYGWKVKDLGQVKVPGVCASCGTDDQVFLHVFQRYAHIMWVPLIPLGKSGVTRCDHCMHTVEGKVMSENARLVMQSAKSQFKAPVWMYSGIVVVALLIPWAIWQSDRNDKRVLARLNAPVPGDIYEVKLSDRSYSLFRVERVSGDSVYVGLYNYETDKWSGVGSLLNKEDGEFSTDLVGYSRADVLAMRTDEMIMTVRDL